MKLDRNVNPDGKGKYCLINLRKAQDWEQSQAVLQALKVLDCADLLQWGHEAPESQFFVMKYSDPFTADGLVGYAMAVKAYADKGMSENRMMPAEYDNWMEWHREILAEAEKALACEHKNPS